MEGGLDLRRQPTINPGSRSCLSGEKCPEAEFSAVYISVNTSREIHVDANNLVGMPNYG